jgi:hypothetical protein
MALGRPPETFQIAVFPLWGNHFRVNVLTGPDVLSVRIRHSYFVLAGDDGDIISSVPVITRLYGERIPPLVSIDTPIHAKDVP